SIVPSPATESRDRSAAAEATTCASPVRGRRQIATTSSSDPPSGSGREELNSREPSGAKRGALSPLAEKVSRRAGLRPLGSSSQSEGTSLAPGSSASWIAATTRPSSLAVTEARRGRRRKASMSEKSENPGVSEESANGSAAGEVIHGRLPGGRGGAGPGPGRNPTL